MMQAPCKPGAGDSRQDDLEIRRVRPDEDLEPVLELFRIVFGYAGSREQWEWKCRPPWSDEAYAWVGISDGKLIGYVCAVPLRGWHEGRDTPFFQIGDLMVHPRFRGLHAYMKLGMNAFLEEIGAEHPRHLLYGFSRHRAFAWFRRIGLIDVVEMAHEAVMEPLAEARPDVELSEWDWESGELDPLWERMKGGLSTALVRDRLYLGWRYRDHPFYTYRLVGVGVAGKTAGWLVVRTSGKHPSSLPGELSVVDLLLHEQDLAGVLSEAARYLGVERLRLWLPSWFAGGALHAQATRIHVMHIHSASGAPAGSLRDNLYYTLGDADWH